MRTAERRLHLDLSPSAPAEARRLAADLALEPLTAEAVRLAVSELVSNAVMHGSGPITVVLRELAHGIRVAVRDAGPGFRPPGEPRMPPPHSRGGRGLALIAMLASEWGIEPTPSTEVWAVIPFQG